jgi:hypothetical protein
MTTEEQIADLKGRVMTGLDFVKSDVEFGDFLSAHQKADQMVRLIQCLQVLEKGEQRLSPLCDPTPDRLKAELHTSPCVSDSPRNK